MTKRNRLGWAAGVLGLVAWLAVGGCVIDVQPIPDGGSSPTTIKIRLINASGVALDPQLYLSATAVGTDELFVDGNKYTHFGFLNLGYLDSGDTESLDIECSAARIIATKGGSFGDDPANPIGSGQQRVLTQDLNVVCGDTVTFTFSRTGAQYSTTVSVSQ